MILYLLFHLKTRSNLLNKNNHTKSYQISRSSVLLFRDFGVFKNGAYGCEDTFHGFVGINSSVDTFVTVITNQGGSGFVVRRQPFPQRFLVVVTSAGQRFPGGVIRHLDLWRVEFRVVGSSAGNVK